MTSPRASVLALVGLTLAAALAGIGLAACDPTAGRGGRQVGDGGFPSSTDPNKDYDGDGYTPNLGDCNDRDPTVYPGAPELCDGRDHDCNSVVDDICDVDKDGFAARAGGGRPGGDCNDRDPLVGPDAMEVAGNNIDDNCDGRSDEAATPCPAGSPNDAASYAAAFELCGPWLVSASFNAGADKRGRGIKADYGTYRPKAGASFVALSTGMAADKNDAGYAVPQPGTDFFKKASNPAPMTNNNPTCGNKDPDPLQVNDYTELTLTLKVPQNARSFSFRLNFMSSEYPEFVGTEYNDKFLALLESKAYSGNISFDKFKNPITVNAGFFDVCDSALICEGTKQNKCGQSLAQLAGTGYEDTAPLEADRIGGGTGWLTTTSPVAPGETATLRFIIFDEGDGIYDSAVLIDDFQWQLEAAADGPITIP